MRITRTRVIVACALVVSLGVVLFVMIIRRGPSTTIRSRRSLRAIMLMPKDLRQFPVESYVKSGDSFVYHISDRRDGYRHCRLQIDTAEGDLNEWKDAFRDYLKARGDFAEPRIGSPHPTLFRWSSADSHGWVTFKGPGPAGELSISLEFYELGLVYKLLRTRFGRFLALLLAKIGYPLDAITQAT
jgi:hypothetical protein